STNQSSARREVTPGAAVKSSLSRHSLCVLGTAFPFLTLEHFRHRDGADQSDGGSNAYDSRSACSPLGINYTCVITAPSSPHGVLGGPTFDYSNTPSHAHAPGTPHIGRVTEIGHNLWGGPEQIWRISERVAVDGIIEE